MWINTITLGEFVLHADIRHELWKEGKEAPGVLTDEYLASVGYQVLTLVQPAFDPITQYLAPRTGALINGEWEKHFDVIPLDPASVANNCQQLTSLTPEIAEILQGAGLLAPIQARLAQNLQTAIVNAVQDRLDAFGNTRGYSSTDSLSKYQNLSDAEIATLPAVDRPKVTQFRAECRYLALKIAQTWAVLYAGLDEVKAGTRAMPTSYADVEPLLPALVWPA